MTSEGARWRKMFPFDDFIIDICHNVQISWINCCSLPSHCPNIDNRSLPIIRTWTKHTQQQYILCMTLNFGKSYLLNLGLHFQAIIRTTGSSWVFFLCLFFSYLLSLNLNLEQTLDFFSCLPPLLIWYRMRLNHIYFHLYIFDNQLILNLFPIAFHLHIYFSILS